ncbi:hypothetical protein [Sinomonas sp. ASV322]|uniref:hypothetical protein n=1 Tax=Sinomonas sp. ASV322 TaxID=3041920 RepID=UPI0027DD874E|nr:hypothetical protein [Sinomonas sp. ASV322]MDQ4502167.1 hypothetical protein [Sinomonas sp. ASV322]
MARPLDLVMYERVAGPGTGTWDFIYRDPGTGSELDYIHDGFKRLTDVELAAEYWMARDDAGYRRHRVDMGSSAGSGLSADEAEDLERVMFRFARSPHYDQDAEHG